MLTWNNFEFKQNGPGRDNWNGLPSFYMNDLITERTLEDSLERIDRVYLMTLNAFVREAVVNNCYYSPQGSIEQSLTVWDVPCQRNALPVMSSVLGGTPANFRAAEDVVVKIVSEKPSDGVFKSYKGHFWYRVVGDKVECVLSAVISKDTDQSKLGKV